MVTVLLATVVVAPAWVVVTVMKIVVASGFTGTIVMPERTLELRLGAKELELVLRGCCDANTELEVVDRALELDPADAMPELVSGMEELAVDEGLTIGGSDVLGAIGLDENCALADVGSNEKVGKDVGIELLKVGAFLLFCSPSGCPW